jgi:murein DD-endopeptidase MepM/ murein hydrolase activator NlpD
MGATKLLAAYFDANPGITGKVIDFEANVDKLYQLDLTESNLELTIELVTDTAAFSKWISHAIAANNCRYGIGGYMEHRTIYNRSSLFDTTGEPRRLHLGVDIWGDAGTPVYAPLAGHIHSFADNNNFGDYGATIILQHNLQGFTLYSLYGHLSRKSLTGLQTGQSVKVNQQIATLGDVNENGNWPPHLHFQLILNVGDAKGDYPGVGRYSEKKDYLKNIPDPNLILQLSGMVNFF